MASEQGPSSSRALRVGLIGGMSWHSTALYYERLNRSLEARAGRHRSFDGVIWNLDYAVLYAAAMADEWGRIEHMLCDAGRGLAGAGCDAIAMTAVTAHLFADAVGQAAGLPLLHILEGATHELDGLRAGTVGVLGTSHAGRAPFLRTWLGAGGRELIFPPAERQEEIDSLIQNVLTTEGRPAAAISTLRDAVIHLRERGAQAVVLACTELPLLLPIEDAGIPVIDSVALHVDRICNLITSESHAG